MSHPTFTPYSSASSTSIETSNPFSSSIPISNFSLPDPLSSNSSTSLTAMPTWDELRKEARILESEIDARLDSYSKYAQSLLREDLNNPTNAAAAAVAASVVDPNLSISTIDNHGVELKRLLQRLLKVKEDMSRHIARQDSKDRDALLPILHQYEGKYNAYARDFKRSKLHVTEAMQQLLLGRSMGKEKEQLAAKDALLRERTTLHNSERGLDSLMGQAYEAKQRVSSQNQALMRAMSTFGDIGANFPGINEVLGKISKAKQRDVLVLGLVISICLCFLVWWWLG
eukprot:TRINITY_DN11330_c0_g1_i1.p1 TRINITY_DN11330_c0_g1~~TRINITY_DN11330_c0_g1_i1.p1  ORF type:complete len:285 (+),score=64.35 TRINITY_DN11330_c0_g1_i1:238-1092(+)